MNFKKVIFFSLFFSCILSACKKSTIVTCPSVTLCPAANPSYFAAGAGDTASLYIPNAFTPNGDGNNDRFEIFGNHISTFKCDIYLGNSLVYEIDSLNGYWDGAINGKMYVNLYTLKVTGTTSWGAGISLNGTISAIGGTLFGDTTEKITMNTYVNYTHAQFPDQNNNGHYNPAIPSGEYLVKDSVIVCH
jgi:gliding motility-associated-like protein